MNANPIASAEAIEAHIPAHTGRASRCVAWHSSPIVYPPGGIASLLETSSDQMASLLTLATLATMLLERDQRHVPSGTGTNLTTVVAANMEPDTTLGDENKSSNDRDASDEKEDGSTKHRMREDDDSDKENMRPYRKKRWNSRSNHAERAQESLVEGDDESLESNSDTTGSTREVDDDDNDYYDVEDGEEDDSEHMSDKENTSGTTCSNNNNTNNENAPYWMHPDWIPMRNSANCGQGTTKCTGFNQKSIDAEQKSPKQIRTELKRYIETHCGLQYSKTALLVDLGVNSNSFRKFMDASNYKDPGRAIENGTYWAAARYLEAERVDPRRRKKSVAMSKVKRSYLVRDFAMPALPKTASQRPSNDAVIQRTPVSTLKKTISKQQTSTKRQEVRPLKREKMLQSAVNLMKTIHKMDANGATECLVFDNREQTIKKILVFLESPGVSKSNFSKEALLGVNRKSLDKFILSNTDDARISVIVHGRAYLFFEKKRIFDHEPKSTERLQNEKNYPLGFVVRHIIPPPSSSNQPAVVNHPNISRQSGRLSAA